ncbi:MAG: HAMP domain-containing histidine kinase [Candidatus Sericytochromatia bacterium]|nr:HAMP domain-containing histidine kinase [Candidatus Sericytochromatia bacterium]
MKALYRKLYLYTLMVLIVTLALTGLVTGMIFSSHQEGLVRNVLRSQVMFIQRELNKTQRRNPSELVNRMEELGQDLGWQIALWEKGQLVHSTRPKPPLLTPREQRKLQTDTYVISWDFPGSPQIWIAPPAPRALRPVGGVKSRYLWLQPRLSQLSRPARGPLLAVFLVLVFLALLLLPLTAFLLKPYQELQTAIQRLAQGDFSQKLEGKSPEFKPLTEAFNFMSQQIQEMIAQKQRLIADVSHELRSPLTRLRILLEILGKEAPAQASLVEKGIAETEDLDHIIQDLLDISRLELDQLPLKKTEQDLRYLIFESLERHETLLENRHLEILPEMPEQAVMVSVDRERLGQVFNNLLSNLAKYVPENSQVDLKLEQSPNMAHFIVRDRGPGIATADLEKIFEPFYRPDSSRSRRTGGTGLGLAIARRMARAHGGDLVARLPQDGQGGLEMCLSLPCLTKAPHTQE